MAIVEWFYTPTAGTAPYPSPILGGGGGIGAGNGSLIPGGNGVFPNFPPGWLVPKWIHPKQSTLDKLTAEVTLIDELIAKVAALEEQVRKLEQALDTDTYTVSAVRAAEVIHCSKYGARQLETILDYKSVGENVRIDEQTGVVLPADHIKHVTLFTSAATPLIATPPNQEPKKEIDYLGEIRAMIEGGNTT